MPRKKRCTALVLSLVLIAGIASQAAAAFPLGGSRAAVNDTTAGLLGAVWGWLTGQWANLGHLVAVQTQHVTGVWQKTGPGISPNGGSGCSQPPASTPP